MLKKVANIVRGLSADGVEKAASGHPGMPIGCADIGAVLYGEVMNYDPQQPSWPDRDRFVLSAGHGSMFLYSFLHLAGYDLELEDLKNFRQLGSKTPGHPEYGETEGIETTTGPLGQGIANAVGMALSERMMASRYNTEDYDIVDHYTYTILGDGCMMEGISSEAASLAGHLGLGKLIAIYDANDISIAGDTDLAFTESVPMRFEACEWHVIDNVDGHNIDEIREAIKKAKAVADKPTLIVAKTHIALGAPTKQDSSDAHGAPLGEEEIKGLKERFDLPVEQKFYVADEVKEFFAERVKKLGKARKNWESKFDKWSVENPDLKQRWDSAYNLEVTSDLKESIAELEIQTPIATRKAAGEALRLIADKVPYLVGGSADLAPSNKTYLGKYGEIQKGDYRGRNIRFGVREHAMGAIANGMVLHGGLRPYVATFLVFSDYMKASIRMAALMKQPVIYIFTHDSIYIGEDGPTHQPVEHVESLRLIPNLKVIRPGDEEESKQAWLETINRKQGPTALILSRQNLPHIKKDKGLADFKKGGYIVKEADGKTPELVFIASGSELSLAMEVAEILEGRGKKIRVVSVPDRGQFMNNSQDYIDSVLSTNGAKRVVFEAGVGQGWYQFLGRDDRIISVEKFGCSAPGEEVARKYGFDVQKIAKNL